MSQKRDDRTEGLVPIGALLDSMTLPGGQRIPRFTRTTARILNASRNIDSCANVFEQVGFTTRVLAQLSLPYRNPGNDLRIWRRVNGNKSISIVPDVDIVDGKEVVVGYPYGTMPRLVMIYLCTEAVWRQSPRIELGRSVGGFLKKMGYDNATGGKKGNMSRFKDQMHRLLTCNITYRFEEVGEAQTMELMRKESIARDRVLWWGPGDKERATPTDAWIQLNQNFFEELMEHEVPINLEAVAALKTSSFDLDLYTWLAHKVSWTKSPIKVPYASLQKQLGSAQTSSNARKDFKKACKKSIRRIQALWPALKIEECNGGLRLHPSPTHIPRTKFL